MSSTTAEGRKEKKKMGFPFCCFYPASLPDDFYENKYGAVLFGEDAIPSSLIQRNVRTTGHITIYKRTEDSTAVGITEERFLLFYGPASMERINATWSNPNLGQVEFSIVTKKDIDQLSIKYDVGLFNSRYAGKLHFILELDDPHQCLSLIQQQLAKHGGV
mmetsp:Transcript_23787/g.66443  ORF Transcript_23787/g.66443 Transcript_23787/m.66443 type:complete len:161 (-) Transcript_23787:134-616(-)|eukprot:CAMPEP_0198120166 /NCGR_PEP_ID=MMETSP1442-20131203/28166_1 /TAXON_ID= /ORGANISM="Craspedostauros australis, Strain CCMP3328" /LENGTH=160 /DNA_ID=CAMNT_0043778771 /DNA_START=249 /DNA_END=731 /DNA_ORIENTATION=+